MNDSGLEEAFEEVYSDDTIKHILSGHAVARALRAHVLAQSSLVNHISNTLTDEGNLSVSVLESFYSIAMEHKLTKEQFADVNNKYAFINMVNAISNYLKEKSKESQTAKLWLRYIEYIYIVKKFLVEKRTCNWYLHLQVLMKIINLFADSGHAKCSRLYLKEMLSLSDTNPWLNKQFEDGYHAVRRSNRFWAGLWSDLIIEKTLMQSIKCTGGLTRGRGFEENVRNLCVMSISYSAAVHESMIKLWGVSIGSKDQYIGMGMERRNCDYDHSQQFFNWFEIRNSFNMKDGNLYSLSTGLVSVYGKDPVNCDEAEIIGARVQESFDDSSFTQIKRRKTCLFHWHP